jgi:hypothetical protein
LIGFVGDISLCYLLSIKEKDDRKKDQKVQDTLHSPKGLSKQLTEQQRAVREENDTSQSTM